MRRIGFMCWLLSLVLAGQSCESPPPAAQVRGTEHFLHLGHMKWEDGDGHLVDPRVEQLDFSAYDRLFLGGDLAPETTKDALTMARLDSLFDFASPTVHWAPGNHDYDEPERIPAATGRPFFYHFQHDAIAYLILDTQIDSCSYKGAQFDLIKSVTDTLKYSKYLVLVHHKLNWLLNSDELKPLVYKIPNAGPCKRDWCTIPNNFYPDIYPLLIDVRRRGIQPIVIGGDIGFLVKEFEYQTQDGIWFLATGMAYGDSTDKALVMTYETPAQELSWEFRLIDQLVEE